MIKIVKELPVSDSLKLQYAIFELSEAEQKIANAPYLLDIKNRYISDYKRHGGTYHVSLLMKMGGFIPGVAFGTSIDKLKEFYYSTCEERRDRPVDSRMKMLHELRMAAENNQPDIPESLQWLFNE